MPAGLGHIALNREALAEAERVLAERLPNPAPSADVADAIRAYLATVRLTGFGGQCGEATLRLASMKVGDVILADQAAFKQFAGAKKTARRLMAEPQASWSLTAIGGRCTVRRLPDGSTPPKPGRPPHPNALVLAAMPVGHRRITTWRKVETTWKQVARKRLNLPGATWRGRKHPDGYLVERLR